MSEAFINADASTIYLDGNSLGRLPAGTVAAVHRVVAEQWGEALIDAWEDWIDEPVRLGDRIAEAFLGAAPGTTVLSDSTTVNFFKLVAAALDARPDRHVMVTDRGNFPTDRYVIESFAESRGLEIRWIDSDPIFGPSGADVSACLAEDVALVTFSHVAYRSAAIADMAGINALAHEAGALTLWDLSHSVGAIPIDLPGSDTDLAVGCTYKYLNGGPGSPAFLYVAPRLLAQLRQPIWGWFGQREQFAMGQGYRPVDDIRRYLTGTPSMLALAATKAGIESIAGIGIEVLRDQSVELCEQLISRYETQLKPLGFGLGSPRDAALRAGHVLLTHPKAQAISLAMRQHERVIGDFRAPDGLRLAPVAAYTTRQEVGEAIDRIARLVGAGRHLEVDTAAQRVT